MSRALSRWAPRPCSGRVVPASLSNISGTRATVACLWSRHLDVIDLTPVPPDPALVAAIAALPGRKLIFTNGTEHYAARVIARIGLTGHFLAIHDVIACDYLPKPDPSGYGVLIRRHGIDPALALMVEDMARNLAPAAALGMTTAWIRTDRDGARHGADGGYIHHVIDDLAPWLAGAPHKR